MGFFVNKNGGVIWEQEYPDVPWRCFISQILNDKCTAFMHYITNLITVLQVSDTWQNDMWTMSTCALQTVHYTVQENGIIGLIT